MTGFITKSTGSWFTVNTELGEVYNCKLKGKFRMKGIKTTNPVAVGDQVIFELEKDKQTGVITKILKRENYIIRKSTKLSKVSHIIAANIEQAILIITLAHPRTSTGFVDRFLVTAEAYHIPANLVFNKIDLYNDELAEAEQTWNEIYSAAGYNCLSVSALKGDNIADFKALLKNKRSLLSGHSGVGKSALINAIEPALELRTKDLSGYHKVGMHTTTFAEMHPLSFGGFIIDTPGIKEFGLVDFDRKKIAERFPEMRKYMHDCKFSNCTHIHEPGCAVVEAIEMGEIQLTRYESYLSIVNDDYWEKEENDYRQR